MIYIRWSKEITKVEGISIYTSTSFVDKSKQLDNLPIKQMDQLEQVKKEKLENELYSIVAQRCSIFHQKVEINT